MSDGNGVTITSREMYDSINNLTKEVTSFGGRFDRLESKISDHSEMTTEAKERSHKAFNIATDNTKELAEVKQNTDSALNKIGELEKRRYEDKIQESQKQKDNRNKLYITIISSALPWVLTLVFGLIYIAKNNGF